MHFSSHYVSWVLEETTGRDCLWVGLAGIWGWRGTVSRGLHEVQWTNNHARHGLIQPFHQELLCAYLPPMLDQCNLKWNKGMKGNAILLLALPVQSVSFLKMTYFQATVMMKDKPWTHQQFCFKYIFLCLILIFAKKLKIDLHMVVVLTVKECCSF